MKIRAEVIIKGQVQGVGYRYFVSRRAKAFDLKGWVRNLSNGNVEAVFEGNDGDVRKVLDACREGPGSAVVEDIDIAESEFQNKFTRFEIL